jgi:anti-anti-sigma regulatory factor
MNSLDDRLKALELSVLPIWVYDHGMLKFQWCNDAALPLWRANDRAELLARDFSDLSASTRTRLENYLRALEQGSRVEEDWTLYPRGVATTMTLHGSGVRLDDGRLAILFQAVVKAPGLDASMVRGVEAVRHSSVMVSLLDEGGRALFHNPAMLRAFGDIESLDGCFPDARVPQAIREALAAGGVYAAEIEAETTEGPRVHAVEARRTVDPVDGSPATLVQQTDVTPRRRAELRADEQHVIIEDLHRSLALVEEQRQQILALSAPILDIGRGAVAVPLIGRMDPERTGEISRRLLPAIVERRAQRVIFDLTGLGGVDAAFAESLVALIRAAALLGARSILSGIKPGLAEVLSTWAGDLRGVTIVRGLRQAIEASIR